MTYRTRGFIQLVALAGLVTSASAQDPRIFRLKLDAPSTIAYNAILDSAKAQGLPLHPLQDRAAEGVAKGIDGPKVIASVRTLYADMVIVRSVLGAIASSDELKAAALAMQAGVPPVELGKIKKQRGGLLHSLATPFMITADLVSRGVPVSTAVNAIKSLVGAGAKDKDINDFGRNVKDDIQQGAPPAAAAETRAKGASTAKPESKDDKEKKPQEMETIKL